MAAKYSILALNRHFLILLSVQEPLCGWCVDVLCPGNPCSRCSRSVGSVPAQSSSGWGESVSRLWCHVWSQAAPGSHSARFIFTLFQYRYHYNTVTVVPNLCWIFWFTSQLFLSLLLGDFFQPVDLHVAPKYHQITEKEIWANARETCDSAATLDVQRAIITPFVGSTQIWLPHTEDFLNTRLKLRPFKFRLMLKISHIGCLGLFPIILAQFTVKIRIAAWNCKKKFTRTLYYWGSSCSRSSMLVCMVCSVCMYAWYVD